jgi:hypothetical protein
LAISVRGFFVAFAHYQRLPFSPGEITNTLFSTYSLPRLNTPIKPSLWLMQKKENWMTKTYLDIYLTPYNHIPTQKHFSKHTANNCSTLQNKHRTRQDRRFAMGVSTAASTGIAVGSIVLVIILIFLCVRGRESEDDHYEPSQSHHRRCRGYDMESASEVSRKMNDWQRRNYR